METVWQFACLHCQQFRHTAGSQIELRGVEHRHDGAHDAGGDVAVPVERAQVVHRVQVGRPVRVQ